LKKKLVVGIQDHRGIQLVDFKEKLEARKNQMDASEGIHDQ
jgi:hypothetical protein